jgi:hypothetical protein
MPLRTMARWLSRSDGAESDGIAMPPDRRRVALTPG